MRVLVVHDTAHRRGGAEAILWNQIEGLRARGLEVRLLAARQPGEPAVADYPCFATETGWRNLVRLANPSACRALARALREFRPDVVHVRMFLGHLSPCILPGLRRVPSLYQAVMYEATCPLGTKLLPGGRVCRSRAGLVCHGQGCLSWRAWPPLMLQRALFRRWRGAFDLVAANSRWLAAHLAQEGIGPARVLHNGVPRVDPRPPLQDPPVAAFAGRLAREKGVDVLLEAFRRVREQVPGARLVVAGSGPLDAELRARSEGLPVDWAGHLDAAGQERILGRAWVQAVPSVWEEPFGLAVAEAMMRGTAVVASASGGLAEQVQPGATGFLVEPGQPEPLAARIVQLLRDRSLAEALGAAGRRVALERFTLERYLDDLQDLYRETMERHSSPGR